MTTRIMTPAHKDYADLTIDLVRDFDADNKGATNAVSSLNAMWEYLRELDQNNLIGTKVIIPPGEYLLDVSAGAVDWTDLIAFNLFVEAYGATFYGKGAGKHVIEMLDVRGINLGGLTIIGDPFDTPDSGLVIGPESTNTCGNNYFEGLHIHGFFDVAALWNAGSETTNHNRCWFVNKKEDAGVYAYLGDGYNRFSLASDHTTIRSANTAVSFTNNSFVNNCRLECVDNGGVPLYMESTTNWNIDKDTYFLGYGAAAVRMRQDSTIRNTNVKLDGLMETTQGNGLDAAVEFIVDNGQGSAIEVMTMNIGAPHCSEEFFSLVDSGGGTPGALTLRGVDLITTGPFTGLGNVPLFENNGGTIRMSGTITCKNDLSINLDELVDYSLIVYTNDGDGVTVGDGQAIIIDNDRLSTVSVGRVATAVNYTVKETDELVGVTSTAAARTITLPPSAELYEGRHVMIIDESGGAKTNNITVDGNGKTINGMDEFVIKRSFGFVNLYYNNTEWNVHGDPPTGWADFADGTYTSGSPFSLSANTDTILPNDASGGVQSQQPYNIINIYSPASLTYDALTEDFVVGEVVTGGTSGATATIQKFTKSGTAGTLFLGAITGTFTDNETITGAGSGSADADGSNGPGLIAGRDGDGIGLTFDFKCKPTSGSTTLLEIWIDIGGAVGELYRRLVSFPKGNGVERPISLSVLGYTLDTWELNGAKVYVRADGSAEIYDIRFIRHMTHAAEV